jgi:hypothetical protein
MALARYIPRDLSECWSLGGISRFRVPAAGVAVRAVPAGAKPPADDPPPFQRARPVKIRHDGILTRIVINNYTYAHKDLSIVDQNEEVRGGPASCASPGSHDSSGTKQSPSALCPRLQKIYFEPGAPTTILRAVVMSGSSSAGSPITSSSSAIPENFRDPSHPSEKFGRPVR